MKYLRSKKYNSKFVKDNMIGPNSMVILENMLEDITLSPNMRVLDYNGNGVKIKWTCATINSMPVVAPF